MDDANFMLDPSDFNPIDTYDVYNDDIIVTDEFDDNALLFGEWSDETKDIDDLDEAVLDKYIGTTFILDPDHSPHNVATKVKVRDRSRDSNGRPIGSLMTTHYSTQRSTYANLRTVRLISSWPIRLPRIYGANVTSMATNSSHIRRYWTTVRTKLPYPKWLKVLKTVSR